jgi:hypothetical protein
MENGLRWLLEGPSLAGFCEQNMHTAIESDLPAVHPQLTGGSIARIKMLLSAIAGSVPLTPEPKPWLDRPGR